MATPQLLITDVGLAAANAAMPEGPYIHITAFAIGSAYGYVPEKTDESLNGNILYTGAPLSYQRLPDGTLNIVIRLPPEAGPFDFGEVGVYLETGELFAKAVFDTPQTKFTSLGTNLNASYTFNCLLKLEQSTAIFQIDTLQGNNEVLEVEKWSDVFPPTLSADPDVPLVLVKELNLRENSSLLHQSDASKWTIGTTYSLYGQGIVTNGSTTFVDLPQDSFLNPEVIPSLDNRKYVLEFADGFFRSVETVTHQGDDFRFVLNPDPLLSPPALNSVVLVYVENYYLTVPSEPPAPPPVFGSITYEYINAGTFTLNFPELPENWTEMQATINIQGAGAGGGGGAGSGAPRSNPGASGGGGGAGTYFTVDVPVTPGGSATIIIGAPGIGGNATGGEAQRAQAGGAGGASQVIIAGGSTYTAAGGTGGTGALNPWSSSYQSAPGGSVGGGNGTSRSGLTNSSVIVYGGLGGASRFGPGGSNTGGNSTSRGAGGGGGYARGVNSDSVSVFRGGNGSVGYASITLYDPKANVTNQRYNALVTWLDGTGNGPVPANAR